MFFYVFQKDLLFIVTDQKSSNLKSEISDPGYGAVFSFTPGNMM